MDFNLILLLVNDPAVLKQVCCIERYLKHYKISLIFETNITILIMFLL